MHALIVDGVVHKYPYTIGMLRRDNPNTSFPKRPADELLAQWGMQPVSRTERPDVDHTKNVAEGTPQYVNGAWTQVWEVADAATDEIAQRNEQAAVLIRSQRDALLAATDWLVIKAQETSGSISVEWAAYRQSLRDITTHANFPHLQEADWPVKPE